MKRILLLLLCLVMACGKESSVKPANASTFVRYFNGGNNDIATAIVETADKGLLILATTEIKANETDYIHYKIKLIKTDAYGNMQWQKFYPSFDSIDANTTVPLKIAPNYKASGLTIIGNKIAIAGTSITYDQAQNVASTDMMVLTTDDKGDSPKLKVLPAGWKTNGTAVTTNAKGEFLLLGTVVDPAAVNNMVLVRLNANLDSITFSKTYGNGLPTLVNKLYLDNSAQILRWAGTINRGAKLAPCVVKVDLSQGGTANEGGIISNPGIGDHRNYNEYANDFSAFGQNWAIVGNTDSTKTGTSDIMYYQVEPANANVRAFKTFPMVEKDAQGQNETGNSICITHEGGLLLLGTVNSHGTFGRGLRDYHLIKLDPFGEVIWRYSYGSIFDDVGVQVIESSDGGYIVLGTTNLANLKSILVMKTDKDGKIQ